MLQSLLMIAFGLKSHCERREPPVYELVIATGGAKLTEVPAGAKPLDRSRLSPGSPMRGPMELLVLTLSRFVDRPIVDYTALKASESEYRFDAREVAAEVQQGARPAPSIFSAVQQQLGLKLQPLNAADDQNSGDGPRMRTPSFVANSAARACNSLLKGSTVSDRSKESAGVPSVRNHSSKPAGEM